MVLLSESLAPEAGHLHRFQRREATLNILDMHEDPRLGVVDAVLGEDDIVGKIDR